MKGITVQLKEDVCIGGELILEEGQIIKILKESYDFDDILRIVNHEKCSPKTRGFLNFIAKNQEKYKEDISNFVNWFNNDTESVETADMIIGKEKPEDTGFDNLPSKDWSFYTKFANQYKDEESW